METTALTMFQTTVIFSGDVIFIKPFCDFFGVSYKNQVRSVSSDPILSKESAKKYSEELFGDTRERIALSKKGYLRWIQRLNPQIVKEELRDKLIEYQELVFDFLFGSADMERTAKIAFARLNKLKNLKSKITSEISRCEKDMQLFLKGRLVQHKISFPSHESIDK